MSSGGTSTFRAQTLLIAAVPILVGRAKGSWFTADYRVDEVSMESGIDGEAWFVDIADFTGLLTIVLTGTSVHNDYFFSLVQANRTAPTGMAFGASFKDLAGTGSYAGARCKFLKTATGVWGDSVPVRTWLCGVTRMVGGPGSLLPTPVITPEEAALLAEQG